LFCRATAPVADLITAGDAPALQFYWTSRFSDIDKLPAVVVALEIGRRRFPAQIAVDALLVHVEFPGSVLGIFVCRIGHILGIERE
jgi:hypothetical protein